MICNKCGNQVSDYAMECPFCGEIFRDVSSPTSTPGKKEPTAQQQAESAFVFGIIGFILSIAFCFMPYLGIVFSVIGLSKANRYIEKGNPESSRVKKGKILSIIGLIISIAAMTGYFVLLVFSE